MPFLGGGDERRQPIDCDLSAHEKAEWLRELAARGYTIAEDTHSVWAHAWLWASRLNHVWVNDDEDRIRIHANGNFELMPGFRNLPRTFGVGLAAFLSADDHVLTVTTKKREGLKRRQLRVQNSNLRQGFKGTRRAP